jgi:hypothetical protein
LLARMPDGPGDSRTTPGQAPPARFSDPAAADNAPPESWGSVDDVRPRLRKIGAESVVPEFRERVLNDGIVNCDALEAFSRDLGRELRRVPVASGESALPKLIEKIEALPTSLYTKAVMRAGIMGRRPTAGWQATQDLRDVSAEIRKAAVKAAKKAPKGSAEAGALRGIEAMFLGIKRTATTQQSKPQLRALAKKASKRFTAMSDHGTEVRAGQEYRESSAYDGRGGVGLTFPLNLLAGAAFRVFGRYAYNHRTLQNEDGTLWIQSLDGGGVGAELSGELLPLAKLFSMEGDAVLSYQFGPFARAAEPEDAIAEAMKQKAERRRNIPLFGWLFSRSAGPFVRELDRIIGESEKGFIYKVRGQHSLIPSKRPAWLTGEKLAKGVSALPIHQAAASIDAVIPGHARGASMRKIAEKYFPAEWQIQSAMSRHLNSPEKIRAIKNNNADPIVNRSVGASNRQLERGKTSQRWRAEGGAEVTVSPVPLVNGTLGGHTSVTKNKIELQRGDAPQNMQVNAAETQDPSLGFRTYGEIWRTYGASPTGAAHPMLCLTERQQTRFPRSAFSNAGNAGASARDVVGDGRAMSPQHHAIFGALEAGLDPGVLARDTEKKLRKLVARYQRFAVDADKVASRDPTLSPPALERINREIFGGRYDVGKSDKARRDFLAHAHNAFTLAAGDLDLTLTLGKASMAAAPKKKPAWARQARAADDFYNVAKEVLANPNLPSLLESIHRLQAVKSPATISDREYAATAKLDLNLLDVPALLKGMTGTVAHLFSFVPLVPEPGKFSARTDIARSIRTSHVDPQQTGTFTTKRATLVGPPGSGILVRLARHVWGRAKRGDPTGEEGAQLGRDAKAALRNLNPQDILGNNQRGIRYEKIVHTPLPVGGLKLAPLPAVSRMSTVVVNEQKGTAPNVLGYIPHTAPGILDAAVEYDTSLKSVILDRLGSDQAYVQVRMAGDLRELFVEGRRGELNIPATARAFRADRFRREALFGSRDVPILSVLYQIASLDRRNPAAPYREITGTMTGYANPTLQYLREGTGRINRMSGLSQQLAAGSGADPTGARAEAPILAMLKDAERRRGDNPALLDEMRALHRKARSWTVEESLDFFTKTEKGREYLRWFHAISKAKGAVVGDMKGDPSFAPQVNHDLFRTMPVVPERVG